MTRQPSGAVNYLAINDGKLAVGHRLCNQRRAFVLHMAQIVIILLQRVCKWDMGVYLVCL